MADESSKPDAAAPAEQAQSQQPVQVQVNDDNTLATYANFCRVTGSPEELIVDFGLNPQPIGVPKDPIDVKQRIIVNFYTANDCWQLCKCLSLVTKLSLVCWKQTSTNEFAQAWDNSRVKQQQQRPLQPATSKHSINLI